jgi:hypothetical protein
LAPDTNQLTGFLAAAGVSQIVVGFRLYIDSHVPFSMQVPLVSHWDEFFFNTVQMSLVVVFDRLEDPPFVMKGWTAAEFTVRAHDRHFLHQLTQSCYKFPNNPGLNGSMTVSTVAIQTKVNCAVPSTFDLDTPGTGTNTIQSISAQGCSGTVTFNPSSSEQQYGVVPATNCGSATSLNFSPVMFWFFHINAQGEPEARGVFCQPTMGIFNIQATANLNNGSLANVTVLSGYTLPNNVTGTQPYNGYAIT